MTKETISKAPAMTLGTLPDLPTPDDLCVVLGVNELGLKKLIAAGQIPPPVINAGRIKRWNKSAVLAALGVSQ